MLDQTVIEFDEATHTYRVGGLVKPSVTQILEPLNRLDGIPKHVLEAAAEFGTHVHAACDLFNKGVLDEAALDPNLVPYLEGWKQFLFDVKGEVIGSEVRVYHKGLDFCGTLDDRIRVPIRRDRTRDWIVDIKSGIVPRSVGAQTKAYERAWQAMMNGQDFRRVHSKDPRRCLQLLGNGKYKLHALDRDDVDWNLFVSSLNVYKFLQEKA